MTPRTATLLAGIPAENPSLFHRVRFSVGDPAAWLALNIEGQQSSWFIVRDIEAARARESVQVDHVGSPADFAPASGLSGDRATATAQAVAEFLRQRQVSVVTTDRTLPYIYAWHIQQAGITVEYAPELGVTERRTKDAQELEWLAAAQQATEATMLMALQTVARATAKADGHLQHAGEPLTSERLRSMISADLLNRGYSTPHGSIVASLPDSADCHARGSGVLKTGQSVIVDIFPQSNTTHYCGDCTRTVVHGTPADGLLAMNAAVVEAKTAAIAAATVGATADAVHSATKETLAQHGFRFARGEISDDPVMPHGTGHGIGLEIHEPILLDDNGGTLLENEVLTIEPGLYSRRLGGMRVEDMIVTQAGGPPLNFNQLPMGLNWA
ncbi:M24 family metallopeptidase [Aureliella helgolandensis]|uniref:Xaa-Pro dipeptidase n=1 Tax=Aureliella helgolandensis TaxID=2527968 RepID=A0A518G2L8_9BACT|nr:M24 family metallopeptidase [Aureliella helgolandensis]QDV22851.1 Xaa-Pro dipeptidase [Aureliella helgolandensis]